jgi:hypothetical protein
MATPTLYPITGKTVSPKTAFLSVTTSATAIVTAGANDACDIKTLIISNISATARTITVDIYRSAAAKTVCSAISIPAYSMVVLIGRDAPVYLEASDALRLTASANSALVATASYELVA